MGWGRRLPSGELDAQRDAESLVEADDSETLRLPRHRDSRALPIVTMSSQFATESWSRPCSEPKGTSAGWPRTEDVITATVTRARTGIASSRVSTTHGRRPTFGSSASQMSPRRTPFKKWPRATPAIAAETLPPRSARRARLQPHRARSPGAEPGRPCDTPRRWPPAPPPRARRGGCQPAERRRGWQSLVRLTPAPGSEARHPTAPG